MIPMSAEPMFKHRNLPERVADHIVLLLATDKLQPGQRLFEGELCKALGVSRIPVREALRILHAQGVVHTEPNRGTFVHGHSSIETTELLKIRLIIEKLALRRLVRLAKSTPDILVPLHVALDEFRRQSKTGDKLATCQADLSFHREIVTLSGSPVLAPLWQSISRGVLVFFMHERQAYYDVDTSIEDHEQLIRIIEAGTITAINAEIERHILNSSAVAPRTSATA